MSETLTSLNSQLYEPTIIVEPGIDVSRVKEIKSNIVKADINILVCICS